MSSKWNKPTKLQVHSFFASMPIISILLNYIMFDQRLFNDFMVWFISFPLIFIVGMGSWRGHVFIGNYIKHRLPEIRQTKSRILIQAFCLIPFMSLSVTFIFFLYDLIHVLSYEFSMEDFKAGLIIGFCVNLIFETLYEADYVLERYKESVEEKQNMQQLSMFQEFDSLKNQVNPHFLFNCFNTLSSLISEDKKTAEKFLNELSKVYRYLLRNNEDGLSTVDNEIRFIRSYYQLLQTRHGEAVQLNIEIDKRYDTYMLPSLTLQLLVENVVKHNVLSKNKPLVIDIFTTAGNKLVVNNNLQRRTVKVPSNKVGLGNIKAKYELLKQQGFQVIDDEKNYTVVLPLIWNNNTETKRTIINETKTV
ncbi:sensor histidine kinase [Lacibacter sp. H407]|uniref:sensor histidine kinase n=1 Tax=Lacibacter sp. H407 TaxID=3133423 RepID=UPI0030BD05E4